MLPNSALWNLELGRTASRSSAKNERLNAFASLFVRFELIERIQVVSKEDKVGLLVADVGHKSYPFKSSPTVWRTRRIRRLKIWCVCFFQERPFEGINTSDAVSLSEFTLKRSSWQQFATAQLSVASSIQIASVDLLFHEFGNGHIHNSFNKEGSLQYISCREGRRNEEVFAERGLRKQKSAYILSPLANPSDFENHVVIVWYSP